MSFTRLTVEMKPPVHLCFRTFYTLCLVLLLAGEAKAEPPREYEFNIPGQNAEAALIQLADQTGVALLFLYDQVQSVNANPVVGQFTVQDALNMLLLDTGLTGGLTKDGVITISAIKTTDEKDRGEKVNTQKSLLAAMIGFLVGSGSVSTVVAEVADGQSRNSTPQLEEVIVTATKRDTSLQDTAISISVMTGAQLEGRGVLSVANAATLIPGVSVLNSEPGNAQIIMRGVSTSNRTESVTVGLTHSTTSTYLDELPISTTIQKTPDLRLVDLARVEVLKGPQGTLYGQSAMGGVVRYITNKPSSEEFLGGISSYASNTDDGSINYGVDGYVNIPLTEALAARFVGYSYENDGYIDTVGSTDSENSNTEKTLGGRVALRWKPTEAVTLDATYLYQDLDLGSMQIISGTFTPVAYTFPPVVPPDLQTLSLSKLVAQHERPKRDRHNIFNINLQVDFDAFSLSAIAAKKENKQHQVQQTGDFVSITEGLADFQVTNETKVDTFELRLVSDPNENDFLDWIAGVWYEDANGKSEVNTIYTGPDIDLFGLFPLTDGQPTEHFGRNLQFKEKAIYGELGLNFTDALKLTLGYRRADVENNFNFYAADGYFDFIVGRDQQVGLDQTAQQDVNLYKFNLEYQLSQDVLIYGLASSGYRAGGFNPGSALAGVGGGDTYDSDTLWNYELGAKTAWLNGRLTANGSIYHIDWADIQLTVIDPDFGFASIENVGKAKISGAELELNYQVTGNLQVAANYSYTDGTLEEDYPARGAVKGDRLPGSAKDTFSIFADWQHPVTADLTLLLRATYRYIGNKKTDLGTVSTNITLPSYDLTDLRVGLSHVNGLSVSLFADNLFNEVAATQYVRFNSYLEGYTITRPRTIGVNIQYDF